MTLSKRAQHARIALDGFRVGDRVRYIYAGTVDRIQPWGVVTRIDDEFVYVWWNNTGREGQSKPEGTPYHMHELVPV